MDHPVITVKLCGGCQQRYDRIQARDEIRAACPFAAFVPFRGMDPCDLLLVLDGCPVRCTDVSKANHTAPILRVCSDEDISAAIEEIRRVFGRKDADRPPQKEKE